MKTIGKKSKKLSKIAKKAHIGQVVAGPAAGELRALTKSMSALATATKAAHQISGRGAYGRGEYTLENPKLNSLYLEHPELRRSIHSVGDETDGIVIRKKEYIKQISSPAVPADFSNESFSLNPGLSGVFAFLSQIANNYSEYEMLQCNFMYEPIVSNASQSGSMGTVVLSCDYNPGNEKFGSFREMVEYAGAMQTRICDPAIFGVECDPRKLGTNGTEYVRFGAVPSGQDIKTYDHGLFQVATYGLNASDFPAGTALGHLYVTYSVKLRKPRLFSAVGRAILGDMYQNTVGLGVSAPWGTAPQANSENSMELTLGSNGDITFPPEFSGRVAVKAYWKATAVVADAITIVSGRVTKVEILGALSSAYEKSGPTGAEAIIFGLFDVKQAGTASNVINVALTSATTITNMNLFVTQVNPAYDNVFS